MASGYGSACQLGPKPGTLHLNYIILQEPGNIHLLFPSGFLLPSFYNFFPYYLLILCMDVKLGLTLREEQRQRVFENKVLRRIFGVNREEVAGGWRRLHNAYAIRVIKSRGMRWAVNVARMGQIRNTYKILDGKHEGMTLLGTPMHRWENNIRLDLREIGWGGVDWIHLAQDRDKWWAVVNTVSIKGAELLD
jgi:hypothetical protein